MSNKLIVGKEYTVHQLIALTFIGLSFKEAIIHHKDGNYLNNYSENLEYTTKAKHNTHHKTKVHNASL